MASEQPEAPNLRIICEELATVKYKWFQIGVQLAIPYHKLKEFEKEEDPLTATVNYWLQGNVKDVPCSWKSIVTALETSDEKALAKVISKKYCRQQGKDNCGAKETLVTPPYKKDYIEIEEISLFEYELETEEISLLEYELEEQTKEIKGFFACLVLDLQRRLEKKNKLEDVVNLLVIYDSENLEGLLSSCTNIAEVFSKLSRYISFFDYDLIKLLTNKLGSNANKKEFKKYEKKFQEFSRHRVHRCPDDMFGNVEKSDRNIYIFKTDKIINKLTVEEVKKLKYEIHKILKNKFLRLLRVEDGCVKFTFRALELGEDSQLTLSEEQQEAFRELGVLSISYGDQFIYIAETATSFPGDPTTSTNISHDSSILESTGYTVPMTAVHLGSPPISTIMKLTPATSTPKANSVSPFGFQQHLSPVLGSAGVLTPGPSPLASTLLASSKGDPTTSTNISHDSSILDTRGYTVPMTVVHPGSPPMPNSKANSPQSYLSAVLTPNPSPLTYTSLESSKETVTSFPGDPTTSTNISSTLDATGPYTIPMTAVHPAFLDLPMSTLESNMELTPEYLSPMLGSADVLIPPSIPLTSTSLASSIFYPRVIKRQKKPRPRVQVNDEHIKDIPKTVQLWEFLLQVLKTPAYNYIVNWTNRKEGVFQFRDERAFAALWGKHRNRPNMTYNKVARALRYYSKRDILNQVRGRLTYRFSKRLKKLYAPEPTELGSPSPTSSRVPGSPTSVPGSSTSVPGSSTSVPGSPTSVPGSPTSVPGSPTSVPGSPTSVPGSSISVPGSSTSVSSTELFQASCQSSAPGDGQPH